MDKTNIKSEKQKCANDDFELLLSAENIAFYSSCEINQVFLYRKADKKFINYFTLFCFEEIDTIDNKSKYLLPNLEKIDENYTLGIVQKRISIDAAKQAFDDIQKGEMNFDGQCDISKKFVLIPKVYCPSLCTNSSVFLNYVLKPNYWGDNYIIEFFDEAKDFFPDNSESRAKYEKINKIIKSVKEINIDLEKVYDRIGNIIFQFPITVLKANVISEKDSISLRIVSSSHPKVQNIKNIHVEASASFDNIISGFFEKDVQGLNFSEVLKVGDDNNIKTRISDKNNGLILYNSEVNFIKYFHIGGKFGIQYSEPRTVTSSYGTKMEIELFSSDDFGNKISQKHYFDRILKRNRNNEIISKSGDYKLFKGKQRSEALDYIRTKLRNCSEVKEICLWDPYLTAADILDTLYFENTGIPFRCITSYQNARKLIQSNTKSVFTKLFSWIKARKEKMSFEIFCKQQSNYFDTHSNNLRVRLKFLAQHDRYGWKFHDRFLIFVPYDLTDMPDVYSLGTSVNILGSNHHIIQKVTNPREIYNNFEELWKLLDNGKCVVKEFK